MHEARKLNLKTVNGYELRCVDMMQHYCIQQHSGWATGETPGRLPGWSAHTLYRKTDTLADIPIGPNRLPALQRARRKAEGEDVR